MNIAVVKKRHKQQFEETAQTIKCIVYDPYEYLRLT